MTSRKGNRATTAGDNKGTPQPTKKQKPAYTTRYIAVDSHLTERNGSTESVYGLAGERPADVNWPRASPTPATNSTPKATR